MKVALELQPCCGPRSGIGTYAYELARHLVSRNGLEFCGNLFNFCGRNNNSAFLKGVSMPVQECRAFPYGVYRRLWHVAPVPYQVLFPDRADLSVFFNFIVPPHMGGRVLTTVHDLTFLRFPETMDRKNLRRIRRDIGYSLDRSDRILTVSQFSKGELVELLHVQPERISVVPNAPLLPANAADFPETAGKLDVKQPYLLYVGTIEPRKNLVRLVRAFALLKREAGIPHQMVLAGGPGWNNGEIYRAAQGAACAGDIRFTGYVTAAEKAALFRNAEAFVFPSLYEGFGIPPLEAMAQGCPVVCSGAASLPEVVGEAAKLVDPLDEVCIAEGIYHVLSDRTDRECLIQRGYRRAKQFTWENAAARLTESCGEVLKIS